MNELEQLIAENRRLVASREELSQRLKEQNEDLERLIYTVSHDLTSPLITIMGFLPMIERSAVAGDFDQVREDIARVTGASRRMKQLLDEMLELSRIGRVVHPAREIALREVARQAVDLAEAPGEVEVVFEIADDLPTVVADPVRLSQVFHQLVDNAVRFAGGHEQPRVEIGVRREDEPVIYVRDNGIGIAPDQVEKIFSLFFKADRNSDGSGIGLALVKAIVELHGGRVWAESEGLGRGATLCLTWPGASSSIP